MVKRLMCRVKFLSKKRGREHKKFVHTGIEYKIITKFRLQKEG